MRQRPGFTLLECLVAMFILLVGLLGIAAVFNAGISARLQAQEMVVSSELAEMWRDWARARLTGGASFAIGENGDFYRGDGNANALPTVGCNVYRGYFWRVASVSNYTAQWLAFDGGKDVVRDACTREDGNPTGASLGPLTQVNLAISRGARTYSYVFVFSNVPLEY